MCSEHALSLIENYIAKRQRSCVAQSVEQSPGLREVLGSNPGTADQCFSAILLQLIFSLINSKYYYNLHTHRLFRYELRIEQLLC